MIYRKIAIRPLRLVGIIFSLLSLSACSTQPQGEHVALIQAPMASEINVTNFNNVPCHAVWAVSDNHALNGPLYWLRALDCAARMAPADARAEAHNWPQSNWQSAFKQGILLDNGNVTPLERRAYVKHLDEYLFDYPSAVRPLIQLWHDRQAAELQLAEERMRYAQLQQKSDSQLDGLRHQQIVLKQELAQTQRKLNSLADIERQLSVRRATDSSDNSHSRNRSDGATSDNATGGKAQP
ncbi:hypothetical protein BTJ39_19870 [Izhakiella australiensis]|uniref:Two-component system QseEF-associated lipoprotein QseG n=1 Tax=Izhakiella australiensis TaxID=1926881 RepID=A0A1S8YFF7_9GAMM|nr:two-component system QseEF-associated lipoprotein QseG [Izhakiella australiensis]OON37592.1 hypothetical protein BTJ39_19870 [Izhakiella australiensis]